MNFTKYLTSIFSILLLMASCSDEMEPMVDPEPPVEETSVTYTLTGEVVPNSRVAYSDADNYMSCRWELGDEIKVKEKTGLQCTYLFTASEILGDGRATFTFIGTSIANAETFEGTATYSVAPPAAGIVQKTNGRVDANGVTADGQATEHLKYGDVLTAEVHGLSANKTIQFKHEQTSSYRILLKAPTAFAANEATLTMKIGDVENQLRLGFAAQKDETVVAYMIGSEATLPVGSRLEFTLHTDSYEYVYKTSVNQTAPKVFATGKYWLANLLSFTPECYRVMELEKMTLEEKVAQMFIVHPERLNGGSTCTAANNTLKSNLSNYAVGGVILFAQNIVSPDQTSKLISDIKANCKYTPFVAVDEEGGRVARLANNASFGLTNVGPMNDIGSTGKTENAYNAGNYIGSYLKQYGFNLDFAPVADVFSNPNNKVIGNRSFSSNPYVVGPMVGACIDGLHNNGLLATIKHFPGHGDTSTDSHTTLPVVTKKWEELLQCEIIPFQQNKDKTDLIMTAHIAVKTVNETKNNLTLPSTLSYNMLTGKLRGELGYKGLIITDALQMNGISNYYSQGDAAVQAIKAGCDIILCPSSFLETSGTFNAVLSAVRNGTLSEARINESVARIIAKKRRLQ